ncbi:MAG: SusC/RagA family TonB-linked outer membrane protein [Candidatus Cyclobacteriaceae bacterium M2_1C_046]
MKKYVFLFFLTAFCFSLGDAWAQERRITGKVTAEDGTGGLPGVNVLLKGTSIGTVTDIDGSYVLNVPSDGGTLTFSFIGFETKEVEIGGRSVIDVVMGTDVTQLNEVIVTGYGDRSKQSFTGSSATLSGDKIENVPVATVDQVLQGNVAGLQLSATSGTPGSVQDIRIRGISSITAGNEPLFVIDGVPVISGDLDASGSTSSLGVLSALNPNDIADIQVLKDATSTSLYGARGANGVIIITTKKGKAGKASYAASAQTGWVSRAVEGAEMLDAFEWAELTNESLVNRFGPTILDAGFNAQDWIGWDGETNVDWRDLTTNNDAMQQSYNFSARGGNENNNFFASVGYFEQDGISVGTNFDRINGKLNFTNRLSEKVLFTTNTLGNFTEQNGILEGSAYFASPEASFLFIPSAFSPYNEDGSYNLDGFGFSPMFNTLYLAENNINRKQQTRVFNTTSVEADIMDNLRFISTIGLDYINNEELYFDNRIHGGGADQNGYSWVANTRNFNWLWKNRLSYNWRISDDHLVDVSAIYEAQKNNFYRTNNGGFGIAAEGLVYPSSAANPDFIGGFANDWAINSLLGIVNYGFKDKIFVDATIRREGSSRFGPDVRWGTFWSAGASYVVTEEAFMEGTADWLSLLKVKASYGKVGNSAVGLNQYQALLGYSGGYYGQPSAEPIEIGNRGLTWENSSYFNGGIETRLFDRVNIGAEYFHRTNYDLLLNVPLSRTTGFNNQTRNIGEMVNKGLEATLDADIVRGENFTWNIGLNVTSLENEVTSLPVDETGEEIGITTGTRKVTVGQQVYSWYMPAWAGVNPDNGNALWYVDGTLGGETTENYIDAERGFFDSAAPTFFGGINTRLDFMGVYLSANLYYSAGNQVYDSWAYYQQSDGQFTYLFGGYASLMDRWQEPGDIAQNPRNVYGNPSLSNSTSTRRLYDGTFARLRDLTLGYNLPASLTGNIGLEKVNIYVKGTNVWTWVKDEDLEFDPEVNADGFISVTAPPLKVWSIGINANF